MRIPDEVRECVCFVYRMTVSGDLRPIGTAFFVLFNPEPVDEPDSGWGYTVTALHVIAQARATGDAKVYLRVNTLAGGVGYVATLIDDWLSKEDKTEPEDVAVLNGTPDRSVYDFKMVDPTLFVGDAEVAEYNIGVGDHVLFPGLFVNHVGASGTFRSCAWAHRRHA